MRNKPQRAQRTQRKKERKKERTFGAASQRNGISASLGFLIKSFCYKAILKISNNTSYANLVLVVNWYSLLIDSDF
jgi:hypothetical protein